MRTIKNNYHKLRYLIFKKNQISFEDFQTEFYIRDEVETLIRHLTYTENYIKIENELHNILILTYNEFFKHRRNKNKYLVELSNLFDIVLLSIEQYLDNLDIPYLEPDQDIELFSLDQIYESFNHKYPRFTVDVDVLSDSNVFKINKTKGLNLPRWFSKSNRV